ncbi:hypothetical protein Ddye_020319 [Dipteronia dyeriana]|uniref:Uncharacterized protein n=1 Tax=Dipteronia dyeriana TaxID=168575 RepID=A0AAD9U0H1_9ROSI|nr:hypothetical protein Ddye_020319 [Dipteronia dyeriana]
MDPNQTCHAHAHAPARLCLGCSGLRFSGDNNSRSVDFPVTARAAVVQEILVLWFSLGSNGSVNICGSRDVKHEWLAVVVAAVLVAVGAWTNGSHEESRDF